MSLISRSHADVTTGARARRRKSSAAARMIGSKFPTEMMRLLLGDDERILLRRVQLDRELPLPVGERFAGGAVHLRDAAEAERVLQIPRTPLEPERAAGKERSQAADHVLHAREGTRRGGGRVQDAEVRAECLHVERRGSVEARRAGARDRGSRGRRRRSRTRCCRRARRPPSARARGRRESPGQLGHRREIGHPHRAMDPDGTVTPSLSAATSRSTSTGRTPALPVANPLASCRMVARTTSSGAGGPCPMNNESIIRRLCSAWSSGASRCRFRAATPVVSPYAGDPPRRRSRPPRARRPSARRRPRGVDRLSAPGDADDLAERQGASGDRDGHWARASLADRSWGNLSVQGGTDAGRSPISTASVHSIQSPSADAPPPGLDGAYTIVAGNPGARRSVPTMSSRSFTTIGDHAYHRIPHGRG